MAELGFEAFLRPETIATICFVFILFVINEVWRSKGKNIPPGPIGLPLVGYLPFLTNTPHLKFEKLASKYGEIFSLRLGSKLVIVLNDPEVIKKAFSKHEFLGRPATNTFTIIPSFQSPFFSSGKAWKEQRRFALHTLRDLGLGKNKMELHIKEEISILIKEMKKCNGKLIQVRDLLTPSISNNICSLVFGSRYEFNDPRGKFLDSCLNSVYTILRQTAGRVFLPWVHKLPFCLNILVGQEIGQRIVEFQSFIRNQIDLHKNTLDANNARDYIDAYLIEMKMRSEKDPDTTFSGNMLTGSVINLFGAGSETIRSTLSWFIYTMAAYPDVQRKVQDEIDNVIGRERMPAFSDSKDMPYTQSVMMEIQRWQTVAPINLLRCTTADSELEGYFIPKGTIVLANLWNCHHSEKHWKNPTEFQPNRFMSDDGKTVRKPECFMPFSYGKRSCPGESLAVVETFLYFTSILQRFMVKLPENDQIDFQGELSVTYSLKPRKLLFNIRI